MRRHNKKVIFRFDTNESKLNSTTLLDSLVGLTEILKAINAEMNTNKDLSFDVEAFNEGSFEITLDCCMMVATGVQGVLAANYTEFPELFENLKVLFKHYLTSNEKQSDIPEVNVPGNNNNVNVIVYNIMNNESVVNSTDRAFNTIDHDDNVNGLSLLDESRKPIIDIKKADFSKFRKSEIVELPGDKIVTRD